MQVLKNFLKILIIASAICGAAPSKHSRLINHRHHKFIESCMNVDADPCDDFYQYSCGKWKYSIDEAGDKFHNIFSMIDYQVNEELAHYMNRINLSNKPNFVRKAYEYYKSCVDVGKYDMLGYLSWMENNEQLKWPILQTPKQNNVEFDWVHMMGVLRRYGMNGIFIEERMMQKHDDPKTMVIALNKPEYGESFVNLTYDNLKLLILSQAEPMSLKTFEELWLEIRNFEELLVKLDDIAHEEDSKLITVKELPLPWQRKYLSVSLKQYIIGDNIKLYVRNIPYMQALDDLLKQYDNRFLCKYLEIRFLWHLHSNGPNTFISTDCISWTNSLLPQAMYWIYEDIHPEVVTAAKEIEQIFDNLLLHFNATLHRNKNGFSDTTLKYLTDKLSNFQLVVGILLRTNTVEVLENHLKSLELNVSDFYGNHLKLIENNFKRMRAGIRNVYFNNSKMNLYFDSAVSPDSKSLVSEIVGVRKSHTVFVPTAFLRPPAYHYEFEEIYKYSHIGFLLAHVYMHSFDYIGLVVDGSGKFNKDQYNNILANSRFYQNYKCLYDLNPNVVNGKIADVTGLRNAYETFFALYPNAQTQTRYIYGEEISLKKLFFLNFAQLFCGSSNPDDFRGGIKHGLNSDRVNDALSHFPEFSTAFGCSPQSRMVSSRTCHLWR